LARAYTSLKRNLQDSGTKYAVSTNSGTTALSFTLQASGMKNGQEGVTTDMSFIASANCVLHACGKPVLCDTTENGNIDPSKVKPLVNGKTHAIIPVHLHGYPAAMNEINEIGEEKDVLVVEDACQAHGAVYHGKKAGSLAYAGCFSFNPMKNMMVGGDGGMVTTNDKELADKIREISDTGRKTCYDCEHTSIGYTGRLNTVNAAIGRVQLRHLKEWNEDRTYIAGEYTARLKDIEGLELPKTEKGVVPAYNKYTIRLKERDELNRFLWDKNIVNDGIFRIPIHLHPVYKSMGYGKKKYPGAEEYARTTLSLPTFPYMDFQDVAYVCDSILEFFDK